MKSKIIDEYQGSPSIKYDNGDENCEGSGDFEKLSFVLMGSTITSSVSPGIFLFNYPFFFFDQMWLCIIEFLFQIISLFSTNELVVEIHTTIKKKTTSNDENYVAHEDDFDLDGNVSEISMMSASQQFQADVIFDK